MHIREAEINRRRKLDISAGKSDRLRLTALIKFLVIPYNDGSLNIFWFGDRGKRLERYYAGLGEAIRDQDRAVSHYTKDKLYILEPMELSVPRSQVNTIRERIIKWEPVMQTFKRQQLKAMKKIRLKVAAYMSLLMSEKISPWTNEWEKPEFYKLLKIKADIWETDFNGSRVLSCLETLADKKLKTALPFIAARKAVLEAESLYSELSLTRATYLLKLLEKGHSLLSMGDIEASFRDITETLSSVWLCPYFNKARDCFEQLSTVDANRIINLQNRALYRLNKAYEALQ